MEDPRKLTAEEEPSEREGTEEEVASIDARIATLRAVERLFDTEGWKHLVETFAYERKSAMAALLSDRANDLGVIGRARGQLLVLDGLLGLPNSIPGELDEMLNQRKKLVGEEDEDDG